MDLMNYNEIIINKFNPMSKQYTSIKRSTNRMKEFQCCSPMVNPIAYKKSIIESFAVFHPLLDRLMEIKMAKCLQHGQLRSYKTQQPPTNIKKSQKILMAPSIEGSLKIYSLRPKTSQIKINYRSSISRPKTTNTVIRSRTSQPRIQRKLDLMSKLPTQYEQDQLKPSLLINKIRRSNIDCIPDTRQL